MCIRDRFGGPGVDVINGDITLPDHMIGDNPENFYPVEWIAFKQQSEPLPNFGNDNLHGGFGDDYLIDPGSDAGGPIRNQLFGESGNDILIGGQNLDYIYGGPDDDILWGRAGVDTLRGGDKGDLVGYDLLFGGDGDDSLSVGDWQIGGAGKDVCKGDQIQFKIDCDDNQ